MTILATTLAVAAVVLGIIAVIMHFWDIRHRPTYRGAKGDTIIIYFYAPWCGYCKRFFPTWNRVKSQTEGQVEMMEINADENQELCQKYGVKKYPTIVKVKGSRQEHFKDTRTVENLIRFIQS